MRRSLRAKLVLWNGLFFIVALSAFGLILLLAGVREAQRRLDGDLARRVNEFSHRPDRRFQPPGEGRPFDPRPNDFRGPRTFDMEGHPTGPGQQPWDQKALQLSLKGESVYSTVNGNDGNKIRVLSKPVRRPDGSTEIIQFGQEADTLELARQGQIWALLVAFPFVILSSAALATLLSRLVVRPIENLTEAAQEVAQNPKVKKLIPVESRDEIGQLAESFNQMTERLQDANASLEASLEQQQRFTSDAAHELRSPLTSISLAAENGLHEDATAEDKERSLTIIRRSAQSMSKLTDVLLSLSRLDRVAQGLPTQPVSLHEIVGELRDAAPFDDRVVFRSEGVATTVQANPDAVKQILTNLIENAIAYAPEGDITITTSGCRLAVTDRGPGIPPEHLPHLFDRFYRVDPSRTRSAGGHGLGLAICRTLAEAQAAEISVVSTLGQGTTFFVDFSESSTNS